MKRVCLLLLALVILPSPALGRPHRVRGPIQRIFNLRPFHRFFDRDDAKPRPAPVPTPTPKPIPPIPPVPVTPPQPPTPGQIVGNGSLWVVCVVPSLTSQPDALGAIERDKAIQEAVTAHQNHFLWLDPQTCPPQLTSALTVAKTAGLPRVVFLDGSLAAGHRVVGNAPLTTAAALLGEIQKYEGR